MNTVAQESPGVNHRLLAAFRAGQDDARNGKPCEPWQATCIERTVYAQGHASSKATVSSANILGLVFVPAGGAI